MILNDFFPVKEDLKNTYQILSYSNELCVTEIFLLNYQTRFMLFKTPEKLVEDNTKIRRELVA